MDRVKGCLYMDMGLIFGIRTVSVNSAHIII
jgi:hypothetical protein